MTPEHLIHVAIHMQKSIATAEQLRSFDPQITNRSEFNFVRVRLVVARQRNGVAPFGMFSAPNQS
jgi:hypothetical protein